MITGWTMTGTRRNCLICHVVSGIVVCGKLKIYQNLWSDYEPTYI